jgi:hypothetical protein
MSAFILGVFCGIVSTLAMTAIASGSGEEDPRD